MDKARQEQERMRLIPLAVEGAELVNALRELFRPYCAFCETNDVIASYRFRNRPNKRLHPTERQHITFHLQRGSHPQTPVCTKGRNLGAECPAWVDCRKFEEFC